MDANGCVEIEPLNTLQVADGLDITIYKNNDRIYGFQVAGYLDFAPESYNAAFSTVFVGIVNAISALTNVKSQTIMDIMLVQINTVLQEMKNTGMDKFVENHYKEQNI